MPKYRGVEQQEIIDSIRNGARFVHDLNIGPECNELIAPLFQEENIAPIVNATSDDELSAAIHASGAEHIFLSVAAVLHYHAQADTQKEGASIYLSLANWGGLTGVSTGARTLLHDEIDHHIKFQSHKNLQPAPAYADPFDQYSLVVGDLEPNAEAISETEKIAAISVKFRELLTPFWQKGGLQSMAQGIGVVFRVKNGGFDFGPSKRIGFNFTGTMEAAQLIANAFPEYHVINSNEEVIAPEAAKSHAGDIASRRGAEADRRAAR